MHYIRRKLTVLRLEEEEVHELTPPVVPTTRSVPMVYGNGNSSRSNLALAYPTLEELVGLDGPKIELWNSIPETRDKSYSYLIVGAGGTGKTALSKAAVRCLRENHGGTLVRLTVAKIAAPTVEAAIQNVKSTFALAEKNRPSIVVIEELETLLPRHSTPNDEFGEIQRQIARLNDGTGVIILGITKHPDLLHPIALQRFEKVLYCQPPNAEKKVCLLKALLREKSIWTNLREVDFQRVGSRTKGFSRHDIVNLVEDLIHANPHADGLGGGHGVLVMENFQAALQYRGGSLNGTEIKRIREFLDLATGRCKVIT